MWNSYLRRGNMQLLTNFLSPIDAHVILGRMLSEGIDAVVIDEGIVWNNYMYSQAFGGVKMLIHCDDIEWAKEILCQIEDNKYLLDKTECNVRISKPRISQCRFYVLIKTLLLILLFLMLGIVLALKADSYLLLWFYNF
ncbi:hypothetical protein HZS38_05225 [Xenorhabdus nematophila]|nr:hypothetical protein D3790_05310 [Xenorhabdus nematophila]CEF30714.1 hypothetical protein XNW1_2810021 [Xenorhabdus nematophila str. Websteri]KHD29150.1 hypothetical protein LH67_05215 [Xenorhabdus nematophila]MBA0018595.1 hypothetical protein [Xenorhabdus nematophila]MCB4425626.1 hypothetical protein [Xenorhabdus nematophila]